MKSKDSAKSIKRAKCISKQIIRKLGRNMYRDAFEYQKTTHIQIIILRFREIAQVIRWKIISNWKNSGARSCFDALQRHLQWNLFRIVYNSFTHVNGGKAMMQSKCWAVKNIAKGRNTSMENYITFATTYKLRSNEIDASFLLHTFQGLFSA